MAPNGLEMFNALASPDEREDSWFFIKPVLRDQHRHGLSNRLGRSVPEQSFRSMPVRPLLMMASSADSTMAARKAAAS